jgi:hypothetical protein
VIERVRRTSDDHYRLWLRPNETTLMRQLVGQLRDQLMTSTDAGIVRRLFPPAYANDAERDAGYQVLTRDTLLEAKLATLATVQADLGPEGAETDTELDESRLGDWMQALNSMRLVLGTRLDADEVRVEIDPDDPDAALQAVYEFLGWLLTQIVDEMADSLPPPSTDAAC